MHTYTQWLLGGLMMVGAQAMAGHHSDEKDNSITRDAPATTEVTKTVAGKATPITVEPFGVLADGRTVELYTLSNSQGLKMQVTNLGATIVNLWAPDHKGQLDDVVLGFDNPQQYLTDSPYFGAVVGRYGNRIAKGQFELEGKRYTLATNNGENHLHGGNVGFDKRLWQLEPAAAGSENTLTFTLTSADGEEGYPGKLDIRVRYTLADDNSLTVNYEAKTNKTTVVNLTQHSYFNLQGHAVGTILNHELKLNAERFTPVDSTLIPTGELMPVTGTPFDFNQPTAIGKRIDQQHQQLAFGKGYDHNWVLKPEVSAGALPAAEVYEPTSGRTLTIYTDQPGIQFYAGNFLDGSITGKEKTVYQHRQGFCLETQHFPDSPNQPAFPSTVLKPGETYRTETRFVFGQRAPEKK